MAGRTTARALLNELDKKPLPELMTKKEVAEYLRLTVSAIDKALRAGGIPVERAISSPRFRKSTIDSWLSGKTIIRQNVSFLRLSRKTDNQ